jgi:DNA-binding transcriptional ArsR family regulator
MQLQANLQLDRVFQALSDSTRRSILRNLVKGERSVSDIAQPFDLTFAAVSKHLKVLEAADLIDRRKQGSFQMIRLNPKNLKTADQWLRFYEQFWSVRMDALKTLLEEKE